MIVFQLDQCVDSKRFARDCTSEGLCQTLRLSSSLRNAEDPELLSSLMAGTHPLVTFDRALPHDHTAYIPDLHPGILVVSNFPAPQTMTIRIAQQTLGRFKTAFPIWHQAGWNNSVVETTSLAVDVWHVEQRQLVHDAYLSFDTLDWQTPLQTVLRQNSTRKS